MDLTQDQKNYFWARVDMSGGPDACWDWTMGLGHGYGTATYNYKSWGTHNLALTLTEGPPPVDKPYACHNCKQNRKCCNPKHLRWDTHAENMKDRDKDGTIPTGELHGMAKLSDFQVKEIRAKYATGKYTYTKLADEYGVSLTLICKIINRKSWAHI